MHHDERINPTALVVGASGVAGSALVTQLVEKQWNVVALSRRQPEGSSNGITYLQADLLDKNNLVQQLKEQRISHVFYAAHKKEGLLKATHPINVQRLRQQIIFAGKFLPVLKRIPGAMSAYYAFTAKEAGAFDKSKANLAMFQNLIEALIENGAPLKHVSVITGAKYYGMHLGHELYPNYQIPFDEDLTPRVPGPNWYYDVEDYLSANKMGFSWSIFRPSFIIGAANDSPFNFGTALAVYFVIQKLKNEPVTFWGDPEASQCTWELSPAKQLAQMMMWSSKEEKAHGQAFNCTTGESFTWEHLWPTLAQKRGLAFETSSHRFSMKKYVDENAALWTEVVHEHQLRNIALSDLISWEFIDKSMAINWDVSFNMNKAIQMGFTDFEPVDDVFLNLFRQLEDMKIIPPWHQL